MAESKSHVSDHNDASSGTDEGAERPRVSRAVRNGAAALAALAIVVTGLVAWAGAHEAPVRLGSPGFSLANAFTPSDEGGALSVELAVPGEVTPHPLLPGNLEPLPANIWEGDLTGWALGVYRTYYSGLTRGSKHPVGGQSPQVLALGSPEGDLYQVLELPSEFDVELLRWRVGETTVDVGLWTQGTLTGVDVDPLQLRALAYQPPSYMELDLTTGQLSASATQELSGPFIQFAGYGANGEQVWASTAVRVSDGHDLGNPLLIETIQPDGTMRRLEGREDGAGERWVRFSPDRERYTISTHRYRWLYEDIVVVDIASGAKTLVPVTLPSSVPADLDGWICLTLGWLDDETLVRSCYEQVDGERVVVWSVDSTTGGVVEVLLDASHPDLEYRERIAQPIEVANGPLLIESAPG